MAANLPSLFDTPTEKPKRVGKPEEQQSTLTVGSLTKAIRGLLENAFTDVVVEGEISNFVNHRSGHRYWTLKDSEASISAVFWKTRSTSFQLKDGMKVVCRGRLTVYPPRGNYQLDVFQVRPVGIGDLQKAFEALYRKLQGEGLFEVSRKRQIPEFPKVIGIITSETGAALQDILTVLQRRYPIVRVVLRPAAVQGVGAELDVARGIQEFNFSQGVARPDVLIVGRGGGSLEDLWAFNEEAVARAIYASQIPIISAVGHEVDVTIADMVADLRAPTPTAAAELATPDRGELLMNINGIAESMSQTVENRLRHLRRDLESAASVRTLRARLLESIRQKKVEVGRDSERVRSKVENKVQVLRLQVDRDVARLTALNPYAVLDRGYAILESADGRVISRKQQIDDGIVDATVVLSDGRVNVRFNK